MADVQLYSYDTRGFVSKRGETHLNYNDMGLLSDATESDRFSVSYYYDHKNRLLGIRNAGENVTQFLYTDPQRPNLLMAIHYPSTGRTFHYLYDDRNTLIAIDSPEQRSVQKKKRMHDK